MAKKKETASRQERFQKLRGQRRNQPGFEGNRTGMQGLWAGGGGDAKAGNEGGEAGANPRGAFLKQLAQNPKVKQIVAGWLGQSMSNEGLGAKTMTDMLDPSDYGLENLGNEEKITSSSTAEEIERYRRQLSNRADWLEAALEETLMEIDRIGRFVPAGAAAGGKKKAAVKKTSARPAAAKKGATAASKVAPKRTVTPKRSVKKSSVTKKAAPAKSAPAKAGAATKKRTVKRKSATAAKKKA